MIVSALLCCVQCSVNRFPIGAMIELTYHVTRVVFVVLDAIAMIYVYRKVTHTFKAQPFLYKKANSTQSDVISFAERSQTSMMSGQQRIPYVASEISMSSAHHFPNVPSKISLSARNSEATPV